MEPSQEIKDLGDSLKLEASILSPKQDAEVKSKLGVMSSIIEAHFAPFIPERAKQNATEAAYGAVIIEDPEFLVAVLDNPEIYDSDELLKIARDDKEHKGFLAAGGYDVSLGFPLIIGSVAPDLLWDELDAKNKRSFEDAAHREYGDIEPKNFFNKLQFTRLLAHELSHSYLDSNLPTDFNELSADYISNTVLNKFYRVGSISRTDFVDTLVEKYGDEVLRVMFGTSTDVVLRSKILAELTEEKKRELMPERFPQQP